MIEKKRLDTIRELIKGNKYSEAEAILEGVISETPNNLTARVLLSKTYKGLEKYTKNIDFMIESLNVVEKAINEKPKFFKLHQFKKYFISKG